MDDGARRPTVHPAQPDWDGGGDATGFDGGGAGGVGGGAVACASRVSVGQLGWVPSAKEGQMIR